MMLKAGTQQMQGSGLRASASPRTMMMPAQLRATQQAALPSRPALVKVCSAPDRMCHRHADGSALATLESASPTVLSLFPHTHSLTAGHQWPACPACRPARWVAWPINPCLGMIWRGAGADAFGGVRTDSHAHLCPGGWHELTLVFARYCCLYLQSGELQPPRPPARQKVRNQPCKQERNGKPLMTWMDAIESLKTSPFF
eukprot:338723-Pelagomonas_calceolata.AAC.10